MDAETVSPIEARTLTKISWRLLPLIAVIYCVAYIDRTNVAFAALTMNKELGLSAYIYGWGAGIFFFSYFLFEIPSNLILEKAGARRWIARIMVSWGLVSALTAFATGPTSFLVLRFLLGAAEAGFFPGMILYFTYWYPAAYRGRSSRPCSSPSPSPTRSPRSSPAPSWAWMASSASKGGNGCSSSRPCPRSCLLSSFCAS